MFDLPEFAKTDDIKFVISAWNKWRGEKLFPSRENVNLRDISKYLNAVMLFDMNSYEDIHIRYFGSRLMDYFGAAYTGTNDLAVTDPEIKDIRVKRMFGIVELPCAAVWTTRGINFGVEQSFSVGINFPVATRNSDKMPNQLLQICIPLEHTEQPVFIEQPKTNVNFADRYVFVDIGAGKADSSVEMD